MTVETPKKLRLAFMGTPEFAVPALRALHAAGHEIVAVYSQPPRRAGRGKKLSPSPVQKVAEQLGIEVRVPVSLKSKEAQAEFAALDLDAAVVAAYGLILPQAILDAPKMGCLNIHGSLLPRWRGAAPVQRAILAGDEETGITIMQMEAGLDTGPMLAIMSTPISNISIDSAGNITEELSNIGAHLIVQVLENFENYEPVPQDDNEATYARKIDKSEARLDFSEPSVVVERQIMAFNPAPGAFFEYDGVRIRVLENDDDLTLTDGEEVDDEKVYGPPGTVLDNHLLIACGKGVIRPALIQKAGKPAMDLQSFLNGTQIPMGTLLQ